MADRILVCVAWPYANGSIHVGQAAGCYLPADIFARFQRMLGCDVAMVSGSDAHGTPVTITADQRGVSPEDVLARYQSEFLRTWERLGIGFDLFTSTHTDNHADVAQDMFSRMREKGFIYNDTMEQAYCPSDDRFLPDRYVEGECPHCGDGGARGDQCDACGRTLDPEELIGMTCRLCGGAPEIRETEHFFMRLSAFEDQLLEWMRRQDHFKPNVRNFTIGFLEGGLKDRAITRDLDWGVPVPLDGYDDKRIYVWFEAVIGYLSATKEWAARGGEPDRWRDFWQDPNARAYYFMGKDNIPFHTVIWPAMLMAYGGLNLPYDVPANEYLNIEGDKVSTSRDWAVWIPDILERYDVDSVRYALAANMPETGDSEFNWADFVRRNNDELVAAYGNLVHRVLSMVARNFGGEVPDPGELDAESEALLAAAQSGLDETARHLSDCRFRNGLRSAMGIARAANRYLDSKAPWRAARTDRQDAARTLWTAMSAINCLKTALCPYMPGASERVHALLGLDGSAERGGWRWRREALRPGAPLPAPKPLFAKLDDSVVEEERARLGGA